MLTLIFRQKDIKPWTKKIDLQSFSIGRTRQRQMHSNGKNCISRQHNPLLFLIVGNSLVNANTWHYSAWTTLAWSDPVWQLFQRTIVNFVSLNYSVFPSFIFCYLLYFWIRKYNTNVFTVSPCFEVWTVPGGNPTFLYFSIFI